VIGKAVADIAQKIRASLLLFVQYRRPEIWRSTTPPEIFFRILSDYCKRAKIYLPSEENLP